MSRLADVTSPANSMEGRSPNLPLGIRLRCPRCKDPLTEDAICAACKSPLEARDGVFLALPPDRSAYFSRFVADYEYIRAAEGRGSHEETYYVSLPHRDITGHNSGQWKIRAKSFDYLISRIINPQGHGKAVLD